MRRGEPGQRCRIFGLLPQERVQGRARVEPSANDDVYANMIDGEKAQDPERKGVAVIIDVESVNGFGAEGPFRMERQAA